MTQPGGAMTHDQATRSMAAERYLLGELSEAERDAFEAHFFDCHACAEAVQMGALIEAGARAGVAAPAARPLPFVPRRQAWYRSPVVPWAIAASMTLVAVAGQFTGTRRDPPGGVQALAPVTLRATARGSEPVIPLAADGLATLALDVDPGESPRLAYELLGPGDARVDAGEVAAPLAGGPLLLLVPASHLRPAGRYRLVVRSAPGGAVLGEYRFATMTR